MIDYNTYITDDIEALQRRKISMLHKYVCKKYFGSEDYINYLFCYNERENYAACAYDKKTIKYKPDATYSNLDHTVLHEFAHILQWNYCGYSKHDLAFCFIVNVLNFDRAGLNFAYIRGYDISQDGGAQNLELSYMTFLKIVMYLSEIKDSNLMCNEAFLIAHALCYTYHERDGWECEKITKEEVNERLKENIF